MTLTHTQVIERYYHMVKFWTSVVFKWPTENNKAQQSRMINLCAWAYKEKVNQ